LKGFFHKEKFGIPLELFIPEMILNIEMVFMKKTPITTVAMNVHLAEGLIEDHINNMHHAEKYFGNKKQVVENILWENFRNMNWCCEHSPVEGTIEIGFSSPGFNGIKNISVPVTTNFGVVCTREYESNYKIRWSYSLS
jgi:hypothetical protein